MSHLAIARKWRPQRFDEIVGQTHITQTLQNAIRLGRVHHAYLLTGARGVGKTSAARILAKALNCTHGPAENPCNECENCQEITRGTHPDVMEIDGASHNRVDDIRDLIETVRYMPSKGKYRIYIIDEVHMVTTQAFNALLKTLEEPPEHVLFIFATTDPQKIPDTVLSRCQRYDFKMMPARTILGRLREICEGEGARIPDGVLGQIAREAAGSMRDGQSLLDQVLSFSEGEITEAQAAEILGLVDRTLLHELLRAVTRGEADRTIEVYGRIIEFGVDIRSFAADILTLLRHATVIAAVSDPERLVDLPAEEIDSLRKMAREAGLEGLGRRFDLLSGAMDEIARSDAPDLVLEMTLVRMARVRPFVPVDALVERLLALERRIASGAGAGAGGGRPSGGQDRGARKSTRAPAAPPMARATRPPAPEPPPPPVEEPPPPEPPAEVVTEPLVDPVAEAKTESGDKEPGSRGALGGRQETAAEIRSNGGDRADQAVPAGASDVDRAPGAGRERGSGGGLEIRSNGGDRADQAVPAGASDVDRAPGAGRERGSGGGLEPDAASWADFVAALPAGKLSALRALLAEGRFLRRDGGDLVIGFPKPSTLELVQSRAGTPELLAALAAAFGGTPTLRCETVDSSDEGPPSPGEQTRADTAERRAAREQTAREHPKVELVQSLFPGTEIGGVRHLTKD